MTFANMGGRVRGAQGWLTVIPQKNPSAITYMDISNSLFYFSTHIPHAPPLILLSPPNLFSFNLALGV